MERVVIKIPHAHFYSWSWWEERMMNFLKENKISHTFSRHPTKTMYEDYYITFVFNNKIDASQFAIVWGNFDWGLAHHPV